MVRVVADLFASNVHDPFEKDKPVDVQRFTLTNAAQVSVQVITLGATITGVKVPDARGQIADIVLGFDDVAGYESAANPYFGATTGRVCNRIGHGRLPIDGQLFQLSRNVQDKHHLHGGFVGFNKAHWLVSAVRDDGVSMQHHNPDGHEGYPGALSASVHFTLTEDSCLHVIMEAETTRSSAVNLTNHSYFNLAGHERGAAALDEHTVQINASQITETDADSIPTGRLLAVDGTSYDLRAPCVLGERLRNLEPRIGYDDNFCVDQTAAVNQVARVVHAPSGRWLEVTSDQPGVQFYTSNFMPDPAKGEQPIVGKSGATYTKHGAFCLETQKYPDAVNHARFPSIVLRPGQKYRHEVIYKFGAIAQ